MTTTKQIDENAILPLPRALEFISFGDEILVLSPECGNFIGLFNANQVEIFKNLQQYTISETEKLTNYQEDFNFVVAQILDREFFNTPLKMSDEYDTAQIYLTNACNLSCPHCYMNSGKANLNELDKNQWCKILDGLAQYGTKEVIFSGGEILLHKDCLEIVKYAKNLGLFVRLKSNGTLWDKEKVQDIAKFIDDIQISIDGINEEMNAKVRGKSNFAKALSCVDWFVKSGVKVVIATTPTYDNIKEIEAGFVEFAQNLINAYGKNISFIVSQKMLGGRGITMKFDEQAKQYAKSASLVMERIYPDYKLNNLAIKMESKKRVRNCGYGNLTIASDGKIYLCNRIDELSPFADIKEGLAEILNKAKEFNRQTSVDCVSPCKNCSVRYICGGGCRIDEYNFKGRQELINGVLVKECSEAFRSKFKQSLLNGLKYLYEL